MPYIQKSVLFRRLSFRSTHPYGGSGIRRVLIIIAILLLAVLLVVIPARTFLREVSTSIAISDATDMITAALNDIINEKMKNGLYDYDYFVSIQKSDTGAVTAVSANMARINTLSSEILRDIISATKSGELDLKIPLGNLLGSNLTLGRGPDVPIRIIMSTSSYANFHNEFSSVGINQSKHQIILDIKVEIDVLLPWEIKSTEVLSEVLIAETIIVGDVPDRIFENAT